MICEEKRGSRKVYKDTPTKEQTENVVKAVETVAIRPFSEEVPAPTGTPYEKRDNTNKRIDSKMPRSELDNDANGSCHHNMAFEGVQSEGSSTLGKKPPPATPQGKPRLLMQVLAALVMSPSLLSTTASYGFSAANLPEFLDPESNDTLTAQETALFVSFISLGATVGALVNATLLAMVGSRIMFLISLPLGAAAWLTQALSGQVWLLLLCRFILGVTHALAKPASVVYILEIAHQDVRGRLFGITTCVRQLGFLFPLIIGTAKLTWRQQSFVFSSLMALPIVGVFYLPNSPRWLVSQGRPEEARKSLVFFRGQEYDTESELGGIVHQAESETAKGRNTCQQLRLLVQPKGLQAFMTLNVLMVFFAFSGVYVLAGYIVVLLQSSSVVMDPNVSSIVSNVIRMVGTVMHLFVIDRVGRRLILAVSYSLRSVSIVCFGWFILQAETNNSAGTAWGILVSLSFSFFLNGLGTPALELIQGELLPTSCRAVGVLLTYCLTNMVSFLNVQTYPQLSAAIGVHGAFWFFAASGLALGIVSLVLVPETAGLSLEDITKSIKTKPLQETPQQEER